MFDSIKTFIGERKRKIIITILVSGVSYYTIKKIRQLSSLPNPQINSKDLRLKAYFEGSQQAITATVIERIPSLYEHIANLVDVPHNDQLKTGTKEERIALWERLAAQTLTRLISGIYSVVLLSLMLRVQINLIGRYTHRDEVEQGSNPLQDSRVEPLLDDITQDKYLAHSVYLEQQGLAGLTATVTGAVSSALSEFSLTTLVHYDDLLRILLDIRRPLEARFSRSPAPSPSKPQSPASSMYGLNPLIASLLPTENPGDRDETSVLGMLVGETRNILESDAFYSVLKQSLDHAFLIVAQNFREAFQATDNTQDTKAENEETPTGDVQINTTLITLPMAKVIPVMRKQFNFVLEAQTNEIVDAVAQLPPLNHYSYDIFSKK